MTNQELINYYTLKLELLEKKEKLGFAFPANYRLVMEKNLKTLLQQEKKLEVA